jgi:tetratricopeptide (TPR) repeat protein
MKRIFVDFDARTADDRVALRTRGSLRDLENTPVETGEFVLLTDRELQVPAIIEDGQPFRLAKPVWEMLEYIISPDEVEDEYRQQAVLWLLQHIGQGARDYRAVLRILPYAEPHLTTRGSGDYLRSRAAEAFGYVKLALAFIDQALEDDPHDLRLVQRRLVILKEIDVGAAVEAFEELRAAGELHILNLAAGVQIIAEELKVLEGERRTERIHELLAMTDDHYSRVGADTAPLSTHALIHVNRAYAFRGLGDSDAAIREFSSAIANQPDDPTSYAARGYYQYPEESAVDDLRKAVQLGFPGYWASYILAHYYVSRDPKLLLNYANEALRFSDVPHHAQSNLHQWIAIATFQLDGRVADIERSFTLALKINPDNEHAKRNYILYKSSAAFDEAAAKIDTGALADTKADVRSVAERTTHLVGRLHDPVYGAAV